MKIGIIGWGLEGQSAFAYFGPDHDYLIVNEEPRDDFPAPTDKIKIQINTSKRRPGLTGNANDLSYMNGIENCDKIVYTPTSLKVLEKIYPPDDAIWSKLTTNQHIFFETVKTKNIIGVTGSKGKGTTSTLLAKLLEAAGKKVHFGGNVGLPVLDFINDVQPDDWVVLELANFQLYKFPYSPHIGVCLMIAPEHMDWHPDMNDYIEAKANLFRHQKADDTAIYYPLNEYSSKIASYSKGKKIPYYAAPGARLRDDGVIVIGEPEIEIMPTSDVRLLGEHNLQNICAAITAAWQIIPEPQTIAAAVAGFSGLEHRLELAGEINGIKYYDDSFGTNPDTAIVALRAFEQPKVLILGGIDKGLPFTDLVKEIAKGGVRHVVLIGDTTEKLNDLLEEEGFSAISKGATNMDDIVSQAKEVAKTGDVVLLSTAASSFDMFTDYKDRGNQFKKAVQKLASTEQ